MQIRVAWRDRHRRMRNGPLRRGRGGDGERIEILLEPAVVPEDRILGDHDGRANVLAPSSCTLIL